VLIRTVTTSWQNRLRRLPLGEQENAYSNADKQQGSDKENSSHDNDSLNLTATM